MPRNAFVYVLMLGPGRQFKLVPDSADYFCSFKMPRVEAAENITLLVADIWSLSHGVRWYRRSLRPLAIGDIVWCDGVAHMLVTPSEAECALLPAGLHIATVNIDLKGILSCKV